MGNRTGTVGGENYFLFRIKIWHILLGNGACTDGGEVSFSFIMSLQYNFTHFKWETGRARMEEKIMFCSESKFDTFFLGNGACTDGWAISFSFIMSLRWNLTHFKWETERARMEEKIMLCSESKFDIFFLGNGACTDGGEISFLFIMSLRWNLTNFKWETGCALTRRERLFFIPRIP